MEHKLRPENMNGFGNLNNTLISISSNGTGGKNSLKVHIILVSFVWQGNLGLC